MVTMRMAGWFEARKGSYVQCSPDRGYAPHAVFVETDDFEEHMFSWDDGTPDYVGRVGFHVYRRPGWYTICVDGRAEHQVEVREPVLEVHCGDVEQLRAALMNPPFPGTRILLVPGMEYLLGSPLSWSGEFGGPGHWKTGYGWSLATDGGPEAEPATLKWDSDKRGAIFNVGANGLAHVGFQNLCFDGANLATGFWNACCSQYTLFDDCEFVDVHQGVTLSRPGSTDHLGLFLNRCMFVGSVSTQMAYTGSCLAVVECHAAHSGNHVAYLDTVDGGLIEDGHWGRWAFGRVALRLNGTEALRPRALRTHGVHVRGLEIEGWVDPIAEMSGPHNGGGNRWNIVGAQLGASCGSEVRQIDGQAVNVGLQQVGPVVLVENVTVKGCIDGFHLDSCEGVRLKWCRVEFAPEDVDPGFGFVVGTNSPTWGLRPCRDVQLEDCVVSRNAGQEEKKEFWKIWPYVGPEWEGLSAHEGVVAGNGVSLETLGKGDTEGTESTEGGGEGTDLIDLNDLVDRIGTVQGFIEAHARELLNLHGLIEQLEFSDVGLRLRSLEERLAREMDHMDKIAKLERGLTQLANWLAEVVRVEARPAALQEFILAHGAVDAVGELLPF